MLNKIKANVGTLKKKKVSYSLNLLFKRL